jgi:sterol desaturase/sphingolipid hydroxylase (fatty acid hydroxylase superfamily)
MLELILFVVGALGWTLAEYVIHRFFGHDARSKNPFAVEHLAHHADVSYFAPTTKKVLTMGSLAAMALPTMALLLGSAGLALGLGFFVMYVAYEVVHRRLHSAPSKNRYGRWARRHHLHHHYRRPKMNHGVTSPIWDFVFGTLDVPDVVRVPRRNALPWMLDAAGNLRPEFANDYALVGRPPK